MNQNDREGQSMGRTTGASGEDAEEQQNRTIEGQESQPGKVWQESDKGQSAGQGGQGQSGQGQYGGQGGQGQSGQGQYGGQGTGSNAGGGTGGESSGGNPQGRYSGQGDTSGSGDTGGRVGGSDPRGGSDSDVRHDTKDEQPENEQIDQTQWQGNRFGQNSNQGGSNG